MSVSGMLSTLDKYASVLNALEDGVIALNSAQEVLMHNASAAALFTELESGAALAKCEPELCRAIGPYIDAAIQGSGADLNRLFLKRRGAVSYLHVRIRSMESPEGGDKQVLIVVRDITQLTLWNSEVNENLSEIEDQLRIARKYQRALFTHSMKTADLSTRAFGQAAFELSGDFFEVSQVSSKKYLLSLGDVQSHGIEVAMKAIALQHLCRVNADLIPSTAGLLSLLNKFVFSDHQDSFWSCCLFAGLFDPQSRVLNYSRAGTPEPIVLRKNGSYELLEVGDTPLGFFEDETYQLAHLWMGRGDRILLYSDGVSDSAPLDDPVNCLGQPRLISMYLDLVQATPEEHVIDKIVQEIVAYHGSDIFVDDFTIAEIIFQ